MSEEIPRERIVCTKMDKLLQKPLVRLISLHERLDKRAGGIKENFIKC